MSTGAGTIIYFAVMIEIFYCLLIRPQQKLAKERNKMLSSDIRRDTVVTHNGLYGMNDR